MIVISHAHTMTLVLQSWRSDTEPQWVQRCLNSVRQWAAQRHIGYRFEDDILFNRVPSVLRNILLDRPQIATDIARLRWIEHVLATETDTAIWLDADVLVFAPERFKPQIGSEGYLFGREFWAEIDDKKKLRVRQNVHNAFIAAERGNPFIPYYRHIAERILNQIQPGPANGLAPQVVGPKLLNALNSIGQIPLSSEVAVLSPLVVKDIAAGGGYALEAMVNAMKKADALPPCAANLCQSVIGNHLDDHTINLAIDALQSDDIFA